MSKVAIKGNASGTGTFTLEAPNSNTDRTLTLPDEAGTVLTSGTDVANFPSGFANGITQADQWRLATNVTPPASNNTYFLGSNLERNDGTQFNYIGSGMSRSGEDFTFPETGIYWVTSTITFRRSSGTGFSRENFNRILVSTNGGSTYTTVTNTAGAIYADTNTCVTASTFIDVTNTTNIKVKFGYRTDSTSVDIMGDSAQNRTILTFIRLGDT